MRFPVHFLEFLEPFIAIGDSPSAVQHLARLTRKSQPSAASSYQAVLCSQGIKRPAYMPLIFDELYFLRMPQVISSDFCWIVKLR